MRQCLDRRIRPARRRFQFPLHNPLVIPIVSLTHLRSRFKFKEWASRPSDAICQIRFSGRDMPSNGFEYAEDWRHTLGDPSREFRLGSDPLIRANGSRPMKPTRAVGVTGGRLNGWSMRSSIPYYASDLVVRTPIWAGDLDAAAKSLQTAEALIENASTHFVRALNSS